MPPVSERQRRAMFAAAEGHSNLGIPKSVGKEFIGADAVEATSLAAGVIFIAPDGAVLLLCRSAQEANYGGHWALPGGKGEPGETPWQIACREACEEIGSGTEHAWIGEPTVIDEVTTPTGMVFTTFVQPVRYRFVPELDAEHSGFVWADASNFPSPMHPQVARVLGMLFPEGSDEMEARDSKPVFAEDGAAIGIAEGIAFDRASVRSKDADGHMRVEITPISKANVCPYYGREIPGWMGLGLDPERAYNLYRDPEELAKGAETFAGKPVMIIHKATKADNHPREVVVGAVGDGVVFDPPYLKAPLIIWDGEAIGLIESGEQRELSSSYRYIPVMTPGVGPDGQRYDGRMTEIVGNHVALVSAGRAGSDVFVQDNIPAGLAATTPNSGIPAGGAKRAAAHDEGEPTMAGKTAKDRAKDEAGLMERLKDKISAEDWKALDEMMAAKAEDEEEEAAKKKAEDEAAEAAEKKKAEDEAAEAEAKKKAEDEEAEKEKAEAKEAMDAALKTAIANERRHQSDIREAERFVRPWVGDLAIAFDSAADVYKAALEANGRSVKDVHPSAYRTILEMTPKPGHQRQTPRLAMDSTKSNGFAERFPDAAKISVSLR
jgi:8-oxo-dGTP pyrophosphatase MutT (NUDIX family)